MTVRPIPTAYVSTNFTAGSQVGTVFAAATNTKGAWLEHVGIKLNCGSAGDVGIRDITSPNVNFFTLGNHNATPVAVVAPDRIFVPAGVGVQAYSNGGILDAHVTVGYTLLT